MDIKQLIGIGTDIEKFFQKTFLSITLGEIALSLLILTFTFILRKLFAQVVVGFLKKLAFKTKTEWDDKLVEAIDPPVRLLILAIGLFLVARTLGLNTSPDSFIAHMIRSLVAFVIFWSLYRAANILALLLRKVVKKTETTLDNLMIPFVNKGMKALVVIIAISVIAREWQYDIGTLLAGFGLGGLAFALAARDTLSNLFGGLTIMIDKPFSIGDWIYTENVEGTVEEIGFRSTRIRTFAQALVTVPNSLLIGTSITNWSKMGKRRVTFRLGITYDTTEKQMKKCVAEIRKMLQKHPGVHPQTIYVYFENFGDSALEIYLYFFTKSTNREKYLEVKEDINLKIMHILDELGLEIAFPSTSVYIEKSAEMYYNR